MARWSTAHYKNTWRKIQEAYFHRNYKARCILDFNNKKGGGGGHDKLCKLLWGVNIFSARGMGRVSPKLVGQNKNAPALPRL